MFARILIKDKFVIIFGLIIFVSGVSIAINYYCLHRSAQTWNNYLDQVSVRNTHLDRIQENFGYGGAIHHFKNFVLRGDPFYLDRFLDEYDDVIQGIENYRVLKEVTEAELDALTDIEEVAKKYRENIDRVADLREKKSIIIDIDQAVLIDDQPAISGFQTLRTLFAERTLYYNAELTSEIKRARTTMITSFLVSSLVLLISFFMLSRNISRPLAKLSLAVKRFSLGEFDLRVDIENTDEIGMLGDGFNAMAEDVNKLFDSLDAERERAERNEKFLQDISKIASVGGWELDLERQQFALTKEGSRIFGFAKNYGIEYETLRSYYLPAAQSILDYAIQDCIDTGSPLELELEMENRQGNVLWIKQVGEVDRERNRLIGMLHDITDRKKAEIALFDTLHDLEHMHGQLTSMINATADAIVAIDVNYQYLQFNIAYKEYGAKVLGIEVKEGMSFLDHTHGDPRVMQEFQDHWNHALTGHSFTQIQPIGNVEHNGKVFELVFNPIVNNQGSVVGAVNVIHDITERKRRDRLKEQFISSVNHELRTPLTAIKGSLSIMSCNSLCTLPEEIKPMLELASRNTDRLERLVGDLLDVQKMEVNTLELNLEIVDLPELMRRSIENCASYALRYEVDLHLNETIPEVELHLDPFRFQQIMDNLLSNACKFSSKGGAVTVSVGSEGNSVNINVRDEGVGIQESFKPFVFDRFRQSDGTLDRNHLGTGLGLAISKQLVERLDGELTFTSKEGAGTTFIVTLPVWQGEGDDCTSLKKNPVQQVSVERS